MPLIPEQQALKQAAQDVEAFPDTLQPFVSIGGQVVIATFSMRGEQVQRVADYYDAATPAAILALLAQLEAQEAPATLICGKCGVDRSKDFCPSEHWQACGFIGVAYKVLAQPGAAESALQELADQAQELGTGYEGMVMPSPPGSAGSGKHDPQPVTFDRRWSLARDGFGLQRDDAEGNYVAYDDAVAVLHAALSQPVQADRRVAWFDALTTRAEAMGFVSIEDALDGFEAARKAAEDRALQPVQAVPDAIRSAGFKMSNVMFNLSQAKGGPNAKLYGELCREWDAAILSLRVPPGDPAQ